MQIFDWINGYCQVQLVSGDALGALYAVNNAGIWARDARISKDTITATFWIMQTDLPRLQMLAKTKGYELKLVKSRGFLAFFGVCRKRPVLVSCSLLLLALTLLIPSRVFFFRVEGNARISDRQILEIAKDYGVTFGASRRDIRSQKVKNGLLAAIPELQWAGVNTSGCVATITVRENPHIQQTTAGRESASIVASRDGIILSCTATKGTPLCHVGQVVTAGDVLISGYFDPELQLGKVYAQGEVYAQTNRDLGAYILIESLQKGEITASSKKYRLKFGKNQINFYKGSGISGTSCDKIYEEKYMTLPGGFVLPVSVVTETVYEYPLTDYSLSKESAQEQLIRFADWYLPNLMVAGHILDRMETFVADGNTFCLKGYYACSEMIGQVQIEEN